MPVFLNELQRTKILKVRAGSFSAALSIDGKLMVWGEGCFGKFNSPHKIKGDKDLQIVDIQISRNGFAALLSTSGQVYTWGANDCG